MLLNIDGTGTDPQTFVRGKLARKERIMGFGHRVYGKMDPRAGNLSVLANSLVKEGASPKWPV